MQLVSKQFEVKTINSALTADVINSLNTIQTSADGTKSIGLNIESASGKISNAVSILEGIHKSDVDYTTTASGELGLPAIILLAGAKPGERAANVTATFNFSGATTKVTKKGKVLNDTGNFVLEILKTFTGKKSSKIKSLMLSGAKVTASEMKSLGLIDTIQGGFVDKYLQGRKVTKKVTKKGK